MNTQAQVRVSDSAHQALTRYAEQHGLRIGEAAGRAVSLLTWYELVREQGGRFFTQEADGTTVEIVLL